MLPRLLLACAVLAASGCARQTPESVLTSYLKHEQNRRYDQAYALLSDSDQAARPLPAYIAEHLSAGPLWLAMAETTRFRPLASAVTDTTAVVTLRATHPDAKALEARAAQVPGFVSSAEDPLLATTTWLVDTLGEQKLPTVEEDVRYSLRPADAGWRVWLGLDLQDAASAAFEDARRFAEDGDLEAARTAYERLTAIEDDPSGVVAYLSTEAKRLLVKAEALDEG